MDVPHTYLKRTETVYFKNVSFRHVHDISWSGNYLNCIDERLTSKLKFHLDNAFWENYSQVLIRFFNQGRLLMRIKSVSQEEVELTQIWRSLNDYEDFLREGLEGHDLKALLRTEGIEVRETGRDCMVADVSDILSHLRKRPHIIQFLHWAWRNAEISVGDPLKEGRLYLPFPEAH